VRRLGLNRTDWAVLVYNAAILALVVFARQRIPDWSIRFLVHLLLAGVIVALARLDLRAQGAGASRVAHVLYPLALSAYLYPEVGLLRNTLVLHDLDPLVEHWDELLLGGGWHLWGARHLPVALLDLAHAVYFSYYVLILAPALIAYRRVPRLVAGYVEAITICMGAHYLLAIAFPVSGPGALRATEMPSGGVFLPIMQGVYRAFDRGGMAFPSTHVAAALLAAFWAGRFYPRRRLAFALWAAAIVPTTVLCLYHYAIDIVAGILTGALAIALSRPLAERNADPAP